MPSELGNATENIVSSPTWLPSLRGGWKHNCPQNTHICLDGTLYLSSKYVPPSRSALWVSHAGVAELFEVNMITSNTCTIKSKHGSFLTVHSDGSATFGAETAESIFRLPSPLTHLQSIAHGTFLGQVDGNIAFASPIISPITAITRAELLSPTAQFVHAILSAEGYGDWAAADPSTVVIDELSGYAGSATYKVSAHGANPVVSTQHLKVQ